MVDDFVMSIIELTSNICDIYDVINRPLIRLSKTFFSWTIKSFWNVVQRGMNGKLTLCCWQRSGAKINEVHFVSFMRMGKKNQEIWRGKQFAFFKKPDVKLLILSLIIVSNIQPLRKIVKVLSSSDWYWVLNRIFVVW